MLQGTDVDNDVENSSDVDILCYLWVIRVPLLNQIPLRRRHHTPL